ncbi:MAG: DNA-directed RNA polymerase subunit L [Candidatus Bathyarchaeia archaeon]
MKIKKLKETSNELKIEIEDFGQTLGNLLQKRLLEDENVDLAGYNIPHPLSSTAIIYIRTKGDVTPKEALLKAIERAYQANKNFSIKLEQALKKI